MRSSMRLVVILNMQIPVRLSCLSGTQFGPDLRRLVLFEKFNMIHYALVKLCRTGCQTKESIPSGKTLKFVSNSMQFTSNLHSKFVNL